MCIAVPYLISSVWTQIKAPSSTAFASPSCSIV